MKTLKILLLTACVTAMAACGKSDTPGDGPNGTVTYGGKRIQMKAPIFEGPVSIDKRAYFDRWKTGGDEDKPYKEYMVGVSSHSANTADLSKVTSFYFFTTLPDEDFEFDVSAGSYSEHCSAVYFMAGGKLYKTSLFFSVPKVRGVSALKSLGIDPETGKEYEIDKLPYSWDYSSIGIPEIITITGGKVSVKWGPVAILIDFNLTFADGKSAKGSGEIPRALITI